MRCRLLYVQLYLYMYAYASTANEYRFTVYGYIRGKLSSATIEKYEVQTQCGGGAHTPNGEIHQRNMHTRWATKRQSSTRASGTTYCLGCTRKVETLSLNCRQPRHKHVVGTESSRRTEARGRRTRRQCSSSSAHWVNAARDFGKPAAELASASASGGQTPCADANSSSGPSALWCTRQCSKRSTCGRASTTALSAALTDRSGQTKRVLILVNLFIICGVKQYNIK